MGIVKTYGTKKEVKDYLTYNGYSKILHLFGKYYICLKFGVGLLDIKRVL